MVLCSQLVSNFATKTFKESTSMRPAGTYMLKNDSKWIKTMHELFRRRDIPEKVRVLFVPNGLCTPDAGEGMVLPLITMFNSTQQLSQQSGIAVPMFTQDVLRRISESHKEAFIAFHQGQHLDVARKARTALLQLGEFLAHPNLGSADGGLAQVHEEG